MENKIKNRKTNIKSKSKEPVNKRTYKKWYKFIIYWCVY